MELIDATPRPDVGQLLQAGGMSWYQGPNEPAWAEDRVYVLCAWLIALR
jgi:glutathionylspermidine synthase